MAGSEDADLGQATSRSKTLRAPSIRPEAVELRMESNERDTL